MALNINTNILSLNAQRNLSLLQPSLQSAMQRLSSGLRINSAADDAAGLAIATRMGAQINGLNTSVNNVNNGIAEVQTADSALNQTTNLMQTMRELAVESANATNTNIDRQSLQAEVAQLQQEVSRIAATTTFNNQNILNGSQQNVAYQVGANAGQTVSLSIGDARASSIGGNVAYTNNANNGMGRASAYNRLVTDGAASGLAAANNAVNNYYAQTLTVTNAAGTTIENGTITLASNSQASDIAASLNRLQGVNVTAYNQIKLTNWTTTATVASSALLFNVQSGTTSQTFNLTSNTNASQNTVFTEIENDINNNANLQAAGVTAGLDSTGNLIIRNNTGADFTVGMADTNGTSVATANVYGTDTANTAATLNEGAANTPTTAADQVTAGGQMNIFLAQGYNISSSISGTTGNHGIFNAAANANEAIVEKNVGISNVLSGFDSAALRVNGTGLALGFAVQYGSVAAVSVNDINLQTLKVYNAAGTVVGNSAGITIASQSSIKTIVNQLNVLNGVTATGSNQATVNFSGINVSAGNITLTVNGTGLTLAGVSGTSTQDQIVAAAISAINGSSTLTGNGFNAGKNGTGNLVISNNTGDDIKLSLSTTVSSTMTASTAVLSTITVIGTDAARTVATSYYTTASAGGAVLASASFVDVAGNLSIALPTGYSIQSSVGGTTAAAGGLFNTTANSNAKAAVTEVGYGDLVGAQTLSIQGPGGTGSLSVAQDDSALAIAQKVNNLAATTGVSAQAATQALMSNISAGGTVSFTLYGDNQTGVSISANVTGNGATADFTALANAINNTSTTTGISASLTNNNSAILLSNADGANIVVANYTNSAGSLPNSGNISGTDASIQVQGVTNSVDNFGNITQVNGPAVTLHYGDTLDNGAASTTIGGQVTFSANGGFNVSSNASGTASSMVGGTSSVFSGAANSTNASALETVNGLNISTVAGANIAITVLDNAINQISTIRGQLGAVQNRFSSTVVSLSSAVQNLTSAKSTINDADYAAETSNLTRSLVIQQAGISILAQANLLSQQVLALLPK